MTSVTLRPDKEKGTVIVAKGKLVGGGDMEKLVGRRLTIERAQEALPGTEEE